MLMNSNKSNYPDLRLKVLSRLRLKVTFLFVLFTTLSVLSSCDDDDNDTPEPTSNIVQTAQSNSNLSTLVSALNKYPDLVGALSGTGTFTVFAPTNTAFENFLDAIGQATIDDVPEDVLKSVLQYHVISTAAVESSKLTN